jgi:hypothetical protein
VLSERHDQFLHDFGCSFLADVGPAIARQMTELRSLNDTAQQTIRHPDQVADIVRAAGRFQQAFTSSSHHTAIVGAINDIVNGNRLIDLGELEQNIVTVDDPVHQCERLLALSECPGESLQRLLLLFQLRYEDRCEDELARLRSAFPEHASMMSAATRACGIRKRLSDEPIASRSGLGRLLNDLQGLRDGGAVLDQHRCVLTGLIERVKRGSLDLGQYPFVGRRIENQKIRRLMVFYAGGATYAEMRSAVEAGDIDVIVGGTTVHNASSFIRSEIIPFATVDRF